MSPRGQSQLTKIHWIMGRGALVLARALLKCPVLYFVFTIWQLLTVQKSFLSGGTENTFITKIISKIGR